MRLKRGWRSVSERGCSCGEVEGGRLPAPVLQLQSAVAAARDCVLSYVSISY